MENPAIYRLPLTFDSSQLLVELEGATIRKWQNHFRSDHYSGDWSGLALRSWSGAIDDLKSGPADAIYQNTSLMEKTPYLQNEVLGAFPCKVRRVRYLRLAPGSEVLEHIDSYKPITDEVRIHIPIVTNSRVDFIVDGQHVQMLAGECWYLDVNAPHAVANRGCEDRIHLVIDCELNSGIRSMLPNSLPMDQLFWSTRFHLRAARYYCRDIRTQSLREGRSAMSIVIQKIAWKAIRFFDAG